MRNYRTNPPHPREHRRASLTVELALVLPLVLLFILGLMEYGRYLMTAQLFNHAAREAARYAVTHLQPVTIGSTTYGNSTTDVANVISSLTPSISLSGQTVQVFASDSVGNNIGTWNNAQPGQSVTVQITGNYQVAVTTFLGLPGTIPMTVKSTMDAESN